MDNKLFFVTLNWSSTELLANMIVSVEANTPEPHTWIVVDNGSRRDEEDKLFEFFGMNRGPEIPGVRAYSPLYPDFPRAPENIRHAVFASDPSVTMGGDFWIHPGSEFKTRMDVWQHEVKRWSFENIILCTGKNLGCILGHNLAFDMAQFLAEGQPHEIVMVDTDVVITEPGWLTNALTWADAHPQAGIIGMEHSMGGICAPAIFLDTFGNWYLHDEQAAIHEPAEGESVGLGLALIRWPVLQAGLHFDTGFRVYFKQDDDLCFQVRAALGLEVWVYPVGCIHYGSGSLKENRYVVDGVANGWDEFDKVKQANQRYFAAKWAWALRNRRKDMHEEAEHLSKMKQVMGERR